MTTTPDLLRDGDATHGVDALANGFVAAIDAVNAPVIAELENAAGGALGLVLETMVPGPALAALIAGIDPAVLTPAQQVSFLLATERLTAWVSSVQNTGLVAFTAPTPLGQPYVVDGRSQVLVDARRTELATHLLWSEGIARTRVATARALAADLPDTAAALATGAVSMMRATAIAEGAVALTSGVDGLLEQAVDGVERVELLVLRRDMLAAFAARVTHYAASHDVGRTRAHVTRTVARLDPAGWAARRARAIRTQSNVTVRHLADGLSELTAVMPTEHALVCAQAIDARARALHAQDGETPIGVHRTHALHQMLTTPTGLAGAGMHGDLAPAACSAAVTTTVGTDSAPASATPVSPRLQLNVTIDLPTLLALREGVGDVTGAGPIPAHVVRELISAGGASIRWLTTNPDGEMADASSGYRIPDNLRALIVFRDQTCALPNCSTPAMACEIDHIQPYDNGGSTTASNLQALCKRHHQAKTHTTPVRSTGRMQESAGEELTAPAPGSPLSAHALADLAPLHARLADLHQQLEDLTELGLTDTALEHQISDLDFAATRLFDDTLDTCLADALPAARHEGAQTVMLRHHLIRHHQRSCHTDAPTHQMRRCPALTTAVDTPPF